MYLKFRKLSPLAKEPTSAHITDAAYDLYSLKQYDIPPGSTMVIETGIAFGFPPGYYGRLEGRSSLASNGIDVFGGIIDSGYTGEIKVVLFNSTQNSFFIGPQAKIAQIIISPYIKPILEEVSELKATDRSDKGFGSSGV
jgi:dUTP pyrophosphatase